MNPEHPDPQDTGTERRWRHSDHGGPEEDAFVEAECAWCGLVTVAIDDLGCIASQADERGLCEFVCPLCGRLATKSVSLLEVKTLLVAGARLLTRAPLELLEAKSGPELSWDDVLDFGLAFELES